MNTFQQNIPEHLKKDPMRGLAHGYPEAREEREARLESVRESFTAGIEALQKGEAKEGILECSLLQDRVTLRGEQESIDSLGFLIYAEYQGSYQIGGEMLSGWDVWVKPVSWEMAQQAQTLCNQPEEDRRDLGLPTSSLLMYGVLVGERAQELLVNRELSVHAVRDVFQKYRQPVECRHNELF
jgi:hypothetical protein